jgi:TRAP-type C4-dicarboxylate transport system permease small subunit
MAFAVMRRWAEKSEMLSRVLAAGVGAVVVLLACVMVGSVLIGVFFRYALNSPLSWTGEVAMLSFTWVVLLTASTGVRDGFHVRIVLLHRALPAVVGRYVHYVLILAVIGFGLALIIAGYQFTEITLGRVSPAIGYPGWLRSASIPVTGVLIVVHGMARLISGKGIDG